MAKTEKRNVVIKVTDTGLKETTTSVDKLGKALDKIGNKPVAVNVSNNVAQAVNTATKSVKTYSTSLSQADRNAKGLANTSTSNAKAFAKQSQGLGGLVHIYATVAANVWALGAAFEALRTAADLKAVIAAQEQLAQNSGRSLGAVTRALKEGSDGALSLANSLKLANTVASAGFGAKFAKDISLIAGGASKALGRDLTDSIERLTKGIAKMEPEILDELGIFVKLEVATRKYAEAHGKLAKDLTETERRQAFANEATKQGAELYGNLSQQVEGNPYARLSASLADVKDQTLSVAAGFINSTGIIGAFAESASGAAAAIFLLVQRLVKMAIPELKTFAEAFQNKSITKATDLIAKDAVRIQKNFEEFGDAGLAVQKNLGGIFTKARTAGSGMSIAFQLGASGGMAAKTQVIRLNQELLLTGKLAKVASAGMFNLGVAANYIGKGVARLTKLAGWIGIAVAAFTALKGVLSSVLDYFGWLDPLIAKWDQLGELTGMWDPSVVEDMSDAVQNLGKDMEDPIKGFKALQEKMSRGFVGPAEQVKFMANALGSLSDGTADVSVGLREIKDSGVGSGAAFKLLEKSMSSTIKSAKALGDVELAKKLKGIQEQLAGKSLKEAKVLWSSFTDVVGVAAMEMQAYSGELNSNLQAITNLNTATQNYINSVKTTTKLDKVLDVFGDTGLEETARKLQELQKYKLDLNATGSIKSFNSLNNTISKATTGIARINKRLQETPKGSKSYTRLAHQLSTITGKLAATRIELDNFSSTPLGIKIDVSKEEIDALADSLTGLEVPFQELIGMDQDQIKALADAVASIKGGKGDTGSLSSALKPLIEGQEKVLNINNRIRAAKIDIARIDSASAVNQLRNAQEILHTSRQASLGNITKEQAAQQKLSNRLSVEQEARSKRILRLENERVIALQDALAAKHSTSKDSAEQESLLNRQAQHKQDEINLLHKANSAHSVISSALQGHLATQQAITAEVKERLAIISAGGEQAFLSLDQNVSQKEQEVSFAQEVSPDANFAIQQASLDLLREETELNKTRIATELQLADIRGNIALINSRYASETAERSADDALHILKLNKKAELAKTTLNYATALNTEKTRELKLVQTIAKISDPFERLEKILKKLDKNTFSRMTKGATEFGKVTKVNAERLKNMQQTDKGYAEQKLLGYSEQAAALGSMFEEGTTAAEAFHDIEQAIHIARMVALAVEESAMLKAAAASIASSIEQIAPNLAASASKIVGQAGIPGIAIAAGFAAMVMGMVGGSGGSGGSVSTAGVDKQLKSHKERLGENGVSGAAELESTALTGAITDLAEIDTRLYSSMDNLQGSIVELGKTFKSVGGSTSRAFGGFSERGLQDTFDDIPEFGKGLVEGGAYKRPIERTLEDVLLQIAPELSTIDIAPSAIKKATDFLSVSFDDITALIITKSLQTKASTGELKKAWVTNLEREFGDEYAKELSSDLNEAFNSTIDTTFGLLQALDPGAHIGSASNSFTASIASALMSSVDSGAFAEDLGSLISVKGLNSEEAADRISVYFNGLSDDMIRSIFPVLDTFRLAGEELGDTLARMVEETAIATQAFSLLGFNGSMFNAAAMEETGVLANMHFQEGLFKGFNGSGAWADLTHSFTEAMLTETEIIDNKIALMEQDLAAGFSKSVSDILALPNIAGVGNLGKELAFLSKKLSSGAITAKQAMQGLRTVWADTSSVIESASAGFTSEGILGSEDFNALGEVVSGIISTGDALGSLISLQEDRSIANAAEETGKALQDYTALIQNLRDTINTMLMGDLSPLSKGAKLELAKGSFDTLISEINNETDEAKRLELIEGLDSTALDYLELSKDYYAGVGNYEGEFNRVRYLLEGVLGELEITAAQLTIDEQQLDVLEGSYDLQAAMLADMNSGIDGLLAAITGDDAPTSGSSSIGTTAVSGLTGKDKAVEALYQSQLGRSATTEERAEYTGTNFSSVRMRHEIANSDEGIARALTGHEVSGMRLNSGIVDIYRDVLGRRPDVEGYKYWAAELQAGRSLESIEQLIKHIQSMEGNGESGLPAFAEGGITSGTSIAGEAGPEAVVPLPDGRTIPVNLGSSFSMAEVVEELRVLRASAEEQGEVSELLTNQIISLLENSNILSGMTARNTGTTLGAEGL